MYKTSDSDRKVNRNIYPDAVTRDRMCLIDPKSGQLELLPLLFRDSSEAAPQILPGVAPGIFRQGG